MFIGSFFDILSENLKPDHHHHFLFLFFSFFSFCLGRGEPLSFFLELRWGSGWRIKAQAAARVGRPGISMGRLTPPKESAGRNPVIEYRREFGTEMY